MKKATRVLGLLLCCVLLPGVLLIQAAADEQIRIPHIVEDILVEEVLTGEAMLAAVPTGANMTAADMKVISSTRYDVAPGVAYHQLAIRHGSGQQNKGILSRIDMGQDVKIKAGYKGYYTPGSTAETRAAAAAKLPSALEIPTAVAASYASIADAEGTVVMATNADYFDVDTGEPRGCLLMEGNVIYAKNRPYFAILKDGTAVIRDAGTDYSDVAEAISGPYYLVKDGVNVAPDTPNREPRNSVGICGDGSVVFFQNDGRQAPDSVGMTLSEMAAVLLDAGCVDALHLDGGGSAMVAARNEGSDVLKIINSPSDGKEREVASCLLVVSTVASDGEFHHGIIAPNDVLYTPNSKICFSATGVDVSGKPVPLPGDVTWALAPDSVDMGTMDSNGLFTAGDRTGTVTVELRRNGECAGTAFVEIVSPDTIYIEKEELSLGFGETTDFQLAVRYQEREVNYNDGDIIWTTTNEKLGAFQGNYFTASEGEIQSGKITAVSAFNADVKDTIQVTVGMQPMIVWDFEDRLNADGTVTSAEEYYGTLLTHSNYGRGGKESLEIVSIDSGEPVRFGQKALKLNYDFTQCGAVTEGALVSSSRAFEIPGSPTGIGVWVYAPDGVGISWKGDGTQAGFWLRGYVKNAAEDILDCDFTLEPKAITDEMAEKGVQPGIYWEGWKYLEADLTQQKSPFIIQKGSIFRLMYVDSTGMGSKSANAIYLDDLQFVYGHTHREVLLQGIPATCTEPGLTDGKQCAECQKILQEQKVIPKRGHDYRILVTPPTCVESGYTTYTCACGDAYTDCVVDELGHSMGEWQNEKEATCAEDGSQIKFCQRSNCDHSETQSIPATGEHTYTNRYDATCNTCSFRRTVEQETVPVYRLYNPYTQEHLMTSDVAEKDALVSVGWSLDGAAWNAPVNGQPVYRLYNPYDDWHTYTTSQEEIDTLTPLGWTVDGVVSASADSDQLPIYRLFNPYEQKNYHLLTAGIDERDLLVNAGWILEGIAWFGMK